MSAKLVTESELSAYERWELPVVDGAAVNGRGGGDPRLPTAQVIEEIQRQAYAEGLALGRKDGLNAGKAQIQRLEKLMATLNEPFAGLDQQVEDELVALVKAVARQLVRREIKTDPGQIVGVVREAMGALPVATRNARLHLHPEDAALVREVLALSEGEHPWRIVEDPVQARGDCRVVTETSLVDASLEARLTALITSILGGEREQDENPGT